MTATNHHPMTLTQKILAAHAMNLTRPWVETGDLLLIRVDWTIASELAWNGMDRTYDKLGRPAIHDPEKFFLAVDHTVDPVTLASDARTRKLVELSRSFAKERGIRHFYDANQTILHTKFYRDLVQPGEVVLGADSHTTSHGGLGAFAIGLGGADVTVAMVFGRSWIEVPEAICVEYVGKLPLGMGGKDVIMKTLGELGRNTVAMERTVEFRGEGARAFSTDMRFTIANMTAEFGGLNGIFEPDGVVAAWLSTRSGYNREAVYMRADEDAPYLSRHRIDLSKLSPTIAKPFSPDNIAPVEAEAGRKLNGVFIGACTTTEEELVLAALVLEQALAEGKKPVETRNRLVVPGDVSIQERLRTSGLLAIYEKAGFRIGPPGCSMCLGVASEKAGKDEVWLTSQNRNYKNRMGEGSLAYLASGPTVAASALDLTIRDPRPYLDRVDRERFDKVLGRSSGGPQHEVHYVEPAATFAATAPGSKRGESLHAGATIRGRVQLFGDNVDTDAIIPGPFCHLTSLPELGEKAFAFVRPEFPARVKAGANIVVAGEGWGSGSSREQAAWALLGAGVKVVIARSFAFIHKRNLVNEGLSFLVVREARFYELAGEGAEVVVDLAKSEVVVGGQRFAARRSEPFVAALQAEGGLVPAIQKLGGNAFSVLAGA